MSLHRLLLKCDFFLVGEKKKSCFFCLFVFSVVATQTFLILKLLMHSWWISERQGSVWPCDCWMKFSLEAFTESKMSRAAKRRSDPSSQDNMIPPRRTKKLLCKGLDSYLFTVMACTYRMHQQLEILKANTRLFFSSSQSKDRQL